MGGKWLGGRWPDYLRLKPVQPPIRFKTWAELGNFNSLYHIYEDTLSFEFMIKQISYVCIILSKLKLLIG